MRPAAFDYHRADSIDHALALLAELGDEARLVAGGYSLVPMMNLRLARPEHLIDINRLPLDHIERDGDSVRLGGLVRHARYAGDPTVCELLPDVAGTSHYIAHPVIRLRGTLGGSLAHADPTAELALMAVLHDATVVARSVRGERGIPAGSFFKGAFTTALEPDEMIVELAVPVPDPGYGHAFEEFSERRGDFAIVAVAALINAREGRIAAARIALAGAGSVPGRNAAVEDFLVGRAVDEPGSAEAGRMLAAAGPATTDIRATAEFRAHLIAELTRRAVDAACAAAGRGR